MSVQGVIATVSTPAVIILSQLLTIARSGISQLAVWDVDRLKYIRFQRTGGACVRIAHESCHGSGRPRRVDSSASRLKLSQ